MKELSFFEEKISNIKMKNKINDFYVFAEAILDEVKKNGTSEITKKFNIDIEDLFYLKVYCDAIKIGDFSKDSFKDFKIEKQAQLNEKPILNQ